MNHKQSDGRHHRHTIALRVKHRAEDDAADTVADRNYARHCRRSLQIVADRIRKCGGIAHDTQSGSAQHYCPDKEEPEILRLQHALGIQFSKRF